jgi:hypothetical protein
MDRSHIIPTIYGYGVCLIAIIVFLISIAGLANNTFRAVYPGLGASHGRIASRGFGWQGFRAEGFKHGAFRQWGVSHRSFGQRGLRPGTFNRSGSGAPIIGAQNQRSANFRNAFIAGARLNALRLLTTDFVLLVVSVLLFLGHWRWLNRPQPA